MKTFACPGCGEESAILGAGDADGREAIEPVAQRQAEGLADVDHQENGQREIGPQAHSSSRTAPGPPVDAPTTTH